jgi:hypothetical protein
MLQVSSSIVVPSADVTVALLAFLALVADRTDPRTRQNPSERLAQVQPAAMSRASSQRLINKGEDA